LAFGRLARPDGPEITSHPLQTQYQSPVWAFFKELADGGVEP
jgi:hypothetical protein